MEKYLIIPDCSDHNRGDQALIWETIRIAKDAGFDGEFYMQYANTDCSQSLSEGIKLFAPVLPHPSRGSTESNINYKSVIIKWGVRALWDFLSSLWILLICRSQTLCGIFLCKSKKQTLSLFRESSAVFVKGGGFLHSFGGLTAFYFIYYHLYTINLAHALRLPVFVMPNSFGPIDGFLCKWQVRNALKRCKLICCREQVSFEYMERCFPSIEFHRSLDLGFYLEHFKEGVSYSMPANKIKVAITVRPYRFPEHKNGEELFRNYVSSMRGFLRWLIEHGYYPVLVQHTLAQNSHEDDMEAIKEVSAGLPDNQYGVFADASFNCRQIKSLYSNFDYIVGTRFHSVIFSIMEGIPAIAIAYGGNKSRGIMKDLGLSEYVIGIDEINQEHLVSLFGRLVSNRLDIVAKLNDLKTIVKVERDTLISILSSLSL